MEYRFPYAPFTRINPIFVPFYVNLPWIKNKKRIEKKIEIYCYQASDWSYVILLILICENSEKGGIYSIRGQKTVNFNTSISISLSFRSALLQILYWSEVKKMDKEIVGIYLGCFKNKWTDNMGHKHGNWSKTFEVSRVFVASHTPDGYATHSEEEPVNYIQKNQWNHQINTGVFSPHHQKW